MPQEGYQADGKKKGPIITEPYLRQSYGHDMLQWWLQLS
jgi:hypothetical protein